MHISGSYGKSLKSKVVYMIATACTENTLEFTIDFISLFLFTFTFFLLNRPFVLHIYVHVKKLIRTYFFSSRSHTRLLFYFVCVVFLFIPFVHSRLRSTQDDAWGSLYTWRIGDHAVHT